MSPRTKIVTELQEQRVKDSEYTPLASLVFFCAALFAPFASFFFGAALFFVLCTSGLFQFDDTANTLHNSKGNKRKSGTLSFHVATDCLISHDLL